VEFEKNFRIRNKEFARRRRNLRIKEDPCLSFLACSKSIKEKKLINSNSRIILIS